jgi:hypothetical protein
VAAATREAFMHARVATFEIADASKLDDELNEMRRQGEEEGPPAGVPAKEFLMLVDKPGGKLIGITLFETEEDLRQGNETLNAMSPGGGAMGRRTSLEIFDVPIHFSAGDREAMTAEG